LTTSILSGILVNGTNGNKVNYFGEKMYKNVLLTDKEIALLKRVVGDYLHEKLSPESKNLTIILNRLREIKPTIKYNQSIN
jgi:hypothetical protein